MLFGFTQYKMCSGVPVVELEISWEFLAKKLDFISARNFRVLFLCLCLNLETKQFEKQNPSWHTPMNTLSNFVMAKFPFKGREGGIVLKILTKIVPPQRCFPPFFVSLSLSLRGRKVMTLPRLLSRKMCDLIFPCCAFILWDLPTCGLQCFSILFRAELRARIVNMRRWHIHIYTLTYGYVYAFRSYNIWYVFWRACCGVGNKLTMKLQGSQGC